MKQTPLHAQHLALGAKMAEFAGYDMPIQYPTGVLTEHNWTRQECGLFDVSHMGQIMVEGEGAAAFWERLTPSAIGKLPIGAAKYTVLTNDQGGIIDDLIITRLAEDSYGAVINAGCKEKDIAWIRSNLTENLSFEEFTECSLLALQGPKAEAVLREALGIDAANLQYMRTMNNGPMAISRLGYTGEDGFEISLLSRNAADIWNRLVQHPAVKPIGLAARDSLRLEMGYPLYGHDLTTETTPVEADLKWIIGKDRSDYIGETTIKSQLQSAPSRKRVGIKLTDKGIAREGSEIFTQSGEKLGDLTSGGFSPTLNEAIGQGYIDPTLAKLGDKVLVRVRGRDIAGVIAPMPFVPAKTKGK